jgi:flagellar biosynthetic protein FliR
MLTSPLELLILRALVVVFRVAGAFTFVPLFGSSAIPARVKAIIVLLCSVVLFPHAHVNIPEVSVAALAGLALSETLLGLLMGLCFQFVLEAVQIAGQLLGFQISFSLVNILDPQSNIETPVLANFQQMIVTLLMLQMNVHHWILRAVQKSFERVPPGSISFTAGHLRTLFRAGEGMWIAGLQLAAPLVLATMVIDVTVGFVSKAAPQVPVMFLSIPLKTLVGFGVLALAMGVWPSFFEKQFGQALSWTWRVLEPAR